MNRKIVMSNSTYKSRSVEFEQILASVGSITGCHVLKIGELRKCVLDASPHLLVGPVELMASVLCAVKKGANIDSILEKLIGFKDGD